MSVADKAGFGPLREFAKLPDGSFIIRVTPPVVTGYPPQEVKVNAEQMGRVRQWLETGVLIQTILGDLSVDEREILMSGIGPTE